MVFVYGNKPRTFDLIIQGMANKGPDRTTSYNSYTKHISTPFKYLLKIIQYSLHDFFEIIFQRIMVVFSCHINTKDTETGIHQAYHCRDSTIVQVKALLYKIIIDIIRSIGFSDQEHFQDTLTQIDLILT